MSLIPIGALVANLAVVRARWPDDLAVWAEFARRELAQKLRELELIFALVIIVVDDSIPLNIARLATEANDPSCKQLDADKAR